MGVACVLAIPIAVWRKQREVARDQEVSCDLGTPVTLVYTPSCTPTRSSAVAGMFRETDFAGRGLEHATGGVDA